MLIPLRRLIAGVGTVLGLFVATADARVVHSLVGPAAGAAPGATIEVQVALLNTATGPANVAIPATLTAALLASGERTPLVLNASEARPPERQSIASGAFALRSYSLVVPPAIGAGLAVLEVQIPEVSPIRTILEITTTPAALPPHRAPKSQGLMTNVVSAQPAAEALRRIFADRVAPHEATYFIYGADDPVGKFQFSFKYKLLDFRDLGPQRMARTLHFAFTQRSLWDLNGDSSPFYDTSYMPEVMYQSLAPMPEKSSGMTWLGFQAAFKHESNGRAGIQSRSLNSVYARTVIAFGELGGWHALVVPEVFDFVSSLDENPDIADYRGYGRVSLVVGRNDGPSLTALFWAGKKLDHVSSQLDFTVPVRTRYLNFETYFLLQYFSGYGESLLSYRSRSETLRAGISLVR